MSEVECKKVLIIGNVDIIAKSIHRLCEKMDAACLAKANGLRALRLLFSTKFDVIIASVFIEDLDEVQLIPVIKASNSINSATPIILMTYLISRRTS